MIIMPSMVNPAATAAKKRSRRVRARNAVFSLEKRLFSGKKWRVEVGGATGGPGKVVKRMFSGSRWRGGVSGASGAGKVATAERMHFQA